MIERALSAASEVEAIEAVVVPLRVRVLIARLDTYFVLRTWYIAARTRIFDINMRSISLTEKWDVKVELRCFFHE